MMACLPESVIGSSYHDQVTFPLSYDASPGQRQASDKPSRGPLMSTDYSAIALFAR